jgi:uncharacterized damage-inducible protein DinB
VAAVLDFYSGWEQHNSLLVKALSPLDDQQLARSAAEGLWPIRMLACHIVATRAWWFNEWMGEGDDDLARMVAYDEDEGSRTRDAREICHALESSWAQVRSCLQRWTEADLTVEFQRPQRNARQGRPWRSRRFIVWHVAEHDVHHGGEISLTLGVHGLTGLDM